jgi:GNAT superfamily N-acetyltransferase
MSTLGFIIRDGLESDIRACMALDHTYETDYVWQMNIEETTGHWQVSFKTQRLPRTLETTYTINEHRLRLATPQHECFLVAIAKDRSEVFGYLTMRNDPVYQTALIQDVVVSRPYRRCRIGSRMVNIARKWAREHHLIKLIIENQTQNYPGIAFSQQTGFKFCGFSDQYFPNEDIAVFFGQSLR